jgi:hypothetical protein
MVNVGVVGEDLQVILSVEHDVLLEGELSASHL